MVRVSRLVQTGWALAAAVGYALAPLGALASLLTTPQPAAATCTPGDELHTCACRPVPHALRDCCCGESHGGPDCTLTASPCGRAPERAVVTLWTSAHPLALPAASCLPGPLLGVAETAREPVPQPVTGAGLPLTPPPRPAASA